MIIKHRNIQTNSQTKLLLLKEKVRMTKIFQRRFFVIVLSMLAGLWITRLALAWPVDPNINVPICTDSSAQWVPAIVSDGSGGAIITWLDKRSGSGEIYAQRVDADGIVKWTANGVAICAGSLPVVVSDGSGGAIITWQDYRNGDNFDIYAQRVDANGIVKWTPNGVAICTASDDQDNPTIVSDGSGGAIITWEDYRNGNSDIYAQRVFPPDVTPPAPVNDLVIFTLTGDSVTLKWTAPGDDGNEGTAAQYDIRYSTSDITDANWDDATQCTDEPAPQPGGTEETFKVKDLLPSTIYYFAIKTADEVPNLSGLSNVAIGKTTVKTGDVSGNGEVTAYDAAMILAFVVGLRGDFPADLMGSPSTTAPRNYVLSLPSLTGKAGNRIQMPIAINDAGLMAGGISLKYDPTILKAISVTPQMLLNGSYWQANTNLDGEVRFAFASVEPTKGQGNLLTVEFEILPNTEGKTSSLILDSVNLSNSLSIVKINGVVTVSPSKFALLQNYPNPFNPETWIPYKLAGDAPVTISVYNAKGQLVRLINLGIQRAGVYLTKKSAAYWDGKNSLGEEATSGVYFYTLQAGKFTTTRRMLIIK